VFKGTWCDRAGVSTTHHFDKKSDGKRVVVHRWRDEPNIVTVRAIKGDFWRGRKPAVEFSNIVLHGCTEVRILEEVYKTAREHF